MSLDQTVKNLLPFQITMSSKSMRKTQISSFLQVVLMFFWVICKGIRRAAWEYTIFTLNEVKTPIAHFSRQWGCFL